MIDPKKVRQIVDAAWKLPANEQTAFVADACGSDDELLRAVREELENVTRIAPLSGKTPAEAAKQSSESFLVEDLAQTQSSAPGVGAVSGSAVGPGSLVAGRYKLVRMVGEGGMGSVWLAEQTEPVRRRVAVKLIKAGADSSQIVARFEAERQALAVMNHPNIARILDGGTFHPAGIPFFVMELVEGIPINKYCDQNRLSLRQRLELFVPVCEAIQHAHQKGIIHRDIKPSNILVSANDGRPFPKVIDFGVAKATGVALTDKSLDTAFGAIVGTPQYMSPEQASTDTLDIDTRTDVYSLGVVLYELLTGSLPFDRKRLGRAAIFEILRIIREEDPSTPSSKLSTDEGLPSISANRNTEPMRLTRMVRGELDWIVMKSLEKDRTRRYDSASGFADDVRRFLAGDSVLAAPPSRWYRLQKVVRRHRGAVIAASLLAISLVAGITGTGIGLWNARVERNNANIARDAEVEQRKQAEAATQQAFLALQSFTDEFVERQFASRTILTPNDRNILRKALAQWELFADAQGDSVQARKIRAEGQYRVARLRERLGEQADARQNYQEAVEILSALVQEPDLDPATWKQLAEARVGLAARLRREMELEPALKQLDLALEDIARAQVPDPDNLDLKLAQATAHSARGVVLRASRDIPGANREYAIAEKTLTALADRYPEVTSWRRQLATLHNNRGNLFLADGDLPAAEKHFRTGLNLRQELFEQNPDAPESRNDLADSHYGLGDWYARIPDNEKSLAEYRLAIGAMQKLNAEFPLVPDYRVKLADLHHNASTRLDRLGDISGKNGEIERSTVILERLAGDFPDIPEFRRNLARERSSLGKVKLSKGDLVGARTDLEFAVKALETLVAENVEVTGYRLDLAQSLEDLAELDLREGNMSGVRALHQRSADLLEQMLNANPGDTLFLQRLADSHWNLAGKLYARNDLANAETAYLRADELKTRLIEKQPDNPVFRNELGRVKMLLGLVYQAQGRLPEAREVYKQAIVIAEQLVDLQPDVVEWQVELAGGLTNLSMIQKEMNDPDANASLERAGKTLEPLAQKHPEKTGVQIAWFGNLVNRSDFSSAAGDNPAAIGLLDQAIEGLRGILAANPQNGQAQAFLINALDRRAPLLDASSQLVRAAGDWEQLSKMVSPGEAILYRSKTAQSLVRAGETGRAIEIAESLADVQQAPTIFARARIHAVAFGNDGDEAQALRSVELLTQLVKMGLDDVERLKNDPDLKSLQQREDFLELIESIGK